MGKNLTPNQIAFYWSFTIAVIVAVFLLALNFGGRLQVTRGFLTIFPISILAIGYFAGQYFIKEFIVNKVHIIYKNIYEKKLTSVEKGKGVDFNTDVFGKVEREVELWSDKRDEEFNRFEGYEQYRRKFLGDISHELKTPIFNIQGYLDTLLEGAAEEPKIRDNFLGRAAKNAERLATIIEDLEAISRLESGKIILDFQDFDIKELVEEVFEDLEIRANEKKVSLVFKNDAQNSFKVRADRESIRQVLMNLVTNSIKYGAKKGYTKIGFYNMDKNILIEVTDDGIGIDTKHLPRLFERFYRVDKHRSREQGGSGLGLSIVKHIIEAHKQTINVRSSKGVGTTFGFTLGKA